MSQASAVIISMYAQFKGFYGGGGLIESIKMFTGFQTAIQKK